MTQEGRNPADLYRLYSDNPKHPLWKVKVLFPSAMPMTETIRAPTGKAAVTYAKNRYEAASVLLLGKEGRRSTWSQTRSM